MGEKKAWWIWVWYGWEKVGSFFGGFGMVGWNSLKWSVVSPKIGIHMAVENIL